MKNRHKDKVPHSDSISSRFFLARAEVLYERTSALASTPSPAPYTEITDLIVNFDWLLILGCPS